MVQVQTAADGTCTLLLNGKAMMTGLTQAQADKLTAAFEARPVHIASAPMARKVAAPARRTWNWRDLLGLRRSAC